MKKLVGVLAVVVAIGFLAIPIGTRYMLHKKADAVSLDDLSKEDIKKNKKNSHKNNYDQDSIEPIDANGVILNRDKADMSKVVGQLVIPSINMNIVIFDGLDNNNLMYGACTMKPKQRFGSGNYAIAGHYMDRKDLLFGGLMDVKKGDVIRTTDKTSIYEYRVIRIQKVDDSRTELISDDVAEENRKPVISLMTCYFNNTGYRYFVVGELDRIYSYKPGYMLRDLKK